jgi:hypothetical protein
MRHCIWEHLFLKTKLIFRGMNGMVRIVRHTSVRVIFL